MISPCIHVDSFRVAMGLPCGNCAARLCTSCANTSRGPLPEDIRCCMCQAYIPPEESEEEGKEEGEESERATDVTEEGEELEGEESEDELEPPELADSS